MGFQFMDFRISMGFMGVLWDYFRILRKNRYFWDFGSRISSKISTSASKISACCGPLAASINAIIMQ